MKNICKNCGKEYTIKKHCKTFCSISCRNKFRWKDKDFRKNMSHKNKETANRPEIKTKTAKLSKERWDDPIKHKEMQMKIKENANKRSVKKQRSINQKKRLKENPDLYNELITRNKERNNSDEYRKAQSEKMRRYWSNPDNAIYMFKSSVKYKEFKLPSGRIVKLQGYEPQVLEQLLESFNENDIAIGVKELNKTIGKIQYTFKNTKRTYYPDFYIKSTNTIIEVKSQWTFDKWKDKNLAKQKACLQQGFNFEFIIL